MCLRSEIRMFRDVQCIDTLSPPVSSFHQKGHTAALRKSLRGVCVAAEDVEGQGRALHLVATSGTILDLSGFKNSGIDYYL